VQAALEELRRENVTRDEFLGLVSHELRTPITVILGNAHVLLRTLQGTSEEHDRALLDISVEAQRLNRIIGNLLVLARLRGGQELDTEPVILQQAIDATVAQHRLRYPDRAVSVTSAKVTAPVLGHELSVEQVLENLLSNAEKYSPPGETIDVVLEQGDGEQSVRVSDRGIGIQGGQGWPFEAFHRSPEATAMNGGIGIGLTVCKRLVEAQGGTIWARNRKGGGAEFWFTLPLCDPCE
jgi:two-component system sensor histidine kinase KdpD